MRRDLADVFATRTEGVKGQQAIDWGLVDAIAPKSGFDRAGAHRTRRRRAPRESDRPDDAAGISLPILGSSTAIGDDELRSTYVDVAIDRDLGCARLVVRCTATGRNRQPARSWSSAGADGVAAARRPRARSTRSCTCGSTSHDDRHLGADDRWQSGCGVARPRSCSAVDPDHWLVREIRLLWTRTLKRLDVSARTLVALIEPGSCFAGVLAELVLAADRSFMLDGPARRTTIGRRRRCG